MHVLSGTELHLCLLSFEHACKAALMVTSLLVKARVGGGGGGKPLALHGPPHVISSPCCHKIIRVVVVEWRGENATEITPIGGLVPPATFSRFLRLVRRPCGPGTRWGPGKQAEGGAQEQRGRPRTRSPACVPTSPVLLLILDRLHLLLSHPSPKGSYLGASTAPSRSSSFPLLERTLQLTPSHPKKSSQHVHRRRLRGCHRYR